MQNAVRLGLGISLIASSICHVPRARAVGGRWRHVVRLVVLTTAIIWTSPVRAAPSITYLGKPTDVLSMNPYFPLSGFHKVKFMPFRPKRPTLLVLASYLGRNSAIECWPLVKALGWFGVLTNVKSTYNSGFGPDEPKSYPTFDLSRARYRSHYIRLQYKDLVDQRGKLMGKLANAALRVYTAYSRPIPKYSTRTDPYDLVGASVSMDARSLPLLVFGKYVESASQILESSSFRVPVPPAQSTPGTLGMSPALAFEQVRTALIDGKDPPGSRLVEEVNAEANILAAIICHGDGNRPKTVCGRHAIRTIERYVK